MPDNIPQYGSTQKILTGIEGFDRITSGGIPKEQTTLIMGGAGCGKTIFALQTLVHGTNMHNEAGIFVAFEEHTRRVIANATTLGWNIPELIEHEQLFFLDARIDPDTIHIGKFDLTGLLGVIESQAKRIGAKRIIFDAIDVLLAFLNDRNAERQELYRLQEWLNKCGFTALLTAKIERAEPFGATIYYPLQFIADCVVILDHQLIDHISRRTIRVMKYRGSSIEANEFPMIINSTGIQVDGGEMINFNYTASRERVSTGIPRFDTMLDGGYYRGSCTLLSGAPGTAKSTLAAAFVQASCQRGERVLYVSFDESMSEIVRNTASVNIQIKPCIQSGLLTIYSSPIGMKSAEEHLMELKHLVHTIQPDALVIDPLSALLNSGRGSPIIGFIRHILHITKSLGITLVATSLVQDTIIETEATPIHISTIADTWVHLSYINQDGERNRALTIIKSRGTAHSNQVCEITLSSHGITLANVYIDQGNILMGSLRREKEHQEHFERERTRLDFERHHQELHRARTEITARIESLQRELQLQEAELTFLVRKHEAQEKEWAERHNILFKLRGAGPPAHPADLPDQSEEEEKDL